MMLRVCTIIVVLLTMVVGRAAAQPSSDEYGRLWQDALVPLIMFVDAASSAERSAAVLSRLDGERARFDRAMIKLILTSPPVSEIRRHLTLVPICQEIATAMVLMTDGLRAGDVSATEAARSWLGGRLIDLRLSIGRLEGSR